MMIPLKYKQIIKSGSIDQALVKCKEDIAEFKSSDLNEAYANALHTMASILKYYTSEYQKALEYLELEIQTRLLHSLSNIDSAYLKSAILNSYLENKEKVIKNVDLTLKNTNDRKVRGMALNVLGDALFETNSASSNKYYKEAVKLFLMEKDEYNLSHVHLSIARLEGFKGKINTALSMCQKELDKGIKSNNPGILGTSYLRFAEIYSYDNQFKESESFAKKAYTIGAENNWKVLKWEAEKLIN